MERQFQHSSSPLVDQILKAAGLEGERLTELTLIHAPGLTRVHARRKNGEMILIGLEMGADFHKQFFRAFGLPEDDRATELTLHIPAAGIMTATVMKFVD